MNEAANVMLELDDIQSGVLRPGPRRTRPRTLCSALTTARPGGS